MASRPALAVRNKNVIDAKPLGLKDGGGIVKPAAFQPAPAKPPKKPAAKSDPLAEFPNRDIDKYLTHLAKKRELPEDFLKGSGVDARMRSILLDWLVQLQSKFNLCADTFFLACCLVDRVVKPLKYEEVLLPNVHDFVYMGGDVCDIDSLFETEKKVLKAVGFNLSFTYPNHYLRLFHLETDKQFPDVYEMSKLLIDVAALDSKMCWWEPKVIAYVAARFALLVYKLDAPDGMFRGKLDGRTLNEKLKTLASRLAVYIDRAGKLQGLRLKYQGNDGAGEAGRESAGHQAALQGTMTARPVVSVYNEKNEPTGAEIKLPAVFKAPIRPDVVAQIHDQISKNKRQPYAVSTKAGEPPDVGRVVGTGRAVARIPRVRGGGTHRSGQAAFGNMCRGGRMFAPTKTYRRWHRRVNVAQRRYAIVSAIAASAVPSLVQARGHVIDQVAEIPLVVTDKVEGYKKTKEAVALLKRLNLWADVEKVYESKRQRAGKGKSRNRRHKQKRGPIVIYNHDGGLVKAFRNIPGVTTQKVTQLNLLKLAPGGHLGRLIFGTLTRVSAHKKGFVLPRPKMVNSDFKRIITSESVLKAIKPQSLPKPVRKLHRNPLRQHKLMVKLNPYAEVLRRAAVIASAKTAAATPAVAVKA
ncbi:60S ribosomal protein L4 [Aphelenchoides fujianensis]|nr:60S ribosomal protein L4 [Aphelenchoides fujianensis]